MIEYHGWITLKFSDYHDGFKKQKEFIENLQYFLNNEFPEFTDNFIRLANFNGSDMLMVNGSHNHRGSKEFYPISIFRWISENGSGSYGLLYIHDEEDKREDFSDKFRVWVLKRGKLSETEDPFLSPYFPECEREFDVKNPRKDFDFE